MAITGPRHLSRVLYMVETGDPLYLPGLRLSDVLFKRTPEGFELSPAGSCDLGQPLITDEVCLALTRKEKRSVPQFKLGGCTVVFRDGVFELLDIPTSAGLTLSDDDRQKLRQYAPQNTG